MSEAEEEVKELGVIQATEKIWRQNKISRENKSVSQR